MRDTLYERMFQHVREGSVSDIVQQDGYHRRGLFVLRDFYFFETQ